MIVLGIAILIFNDVFGERDGFIVFSLLYFCFLTVAVLRWIFAQLRSVISLKKERTKMEMLHLKSQVSPHFFFNTLNNLYGLVEKDPKSAQDLILKLSDLMRYSIYEGQKDWVSIEKEVDYLQNYVSLHKNRYHKEVEVDFQVKIENSAYRIRPLLLILLVENAFKHGVEKLRDSTFVRLSLEALEGRIRFKITNNYDLEEEVSENGIGLENLKRRLEIGYKDLHKLEVKREAGVFTADLSLDQV